MLRTLYRGLLYAGKLFGGGLFTEGVGTFSDLRPSFGLWARESGRGREAPESGRGRFAVDPGRGLEVTGQAEWIGTYYLPVGGTNGGKRRFFAYFGNMEEFLAANVGGLADTLTGTPTVSVDPSGPTITSVAFNTTQTTIRINGQVITAAAYTVLYFTAAAGTAAAGEYTLNFHADTTAGYILEPTATLKLE